jgi:hypothetical protein
MRFLRNPYIVAGLAIAAVLMVFFRIFQPQINRWRAGVEGSTTSTAATAQKAGVGQPLVSPAMAAATKQGPKTPMLYAPPPKNAGDRRKGIDADYVAAHFVEWVDAPRRDPFRAAIRYSGVYTNGLAQGTNPVPTWKLSSILRQTDDRLAVINDEVYGEGDYILGWKVERIDADEVWFRTTNRPPERLRFPQLQVPPPPIEEPTQSRRSKPRLMQEHTVSPQPLN